MLSTACPQAKANHKKNHDYLDWFKLFHMLVKETLSSVAYITEWKFIGFVKRLAFC